MNSYGHWLSLFSAFAHLIIGVPEILKIGPRYLPPSWVVIYAALPGWEWLWPGLFVLTGIVAAVGVRLPGALRWGFRLSALCFLIWGLVGLYSWSIGGGGNIPGSAANLYIAGAAWVLAHYVSLGVRSDVRDERTLQLAEKLGVSPDPDEEGE